MPKDASTSEKAAADGTVGKALDVLDAVAAFGRPVRFTDLLRQSSFPKATLYRLLRTLTAQGMLAYDADRQLYSLGVRLVRLAHTAWSQASIAPLARPVLDRLATRLGLTVHLAQLEAGQVLYLDKRSAAAAAPMFSAAGKIGPAYCTGVGKAMLAHLGEAAQARAISQQAFHRYTPNTLASPEALRADLTEIRRAGFALDREEHEPGIVCAAVPVLSTAGRLLAGLSVTGSTAATDTADLAAHVPALATAAAEIAALVETWHFPDAAPAPTPIAPI
ncbi:MAG: IclR family transcriptional regulator [Pseudomonadota bacterium]